MMLTAVGLTCAALFPLLSAMAVQSAHRLLELPPAWWGVTQLTAAVTGIACLAGAAGALWHVASVILALVASSDATYQTISGGHPGAGARTADRLLYRWGAPLVRRIAAGAIVASITASPALAATEPNTDDLGWQPTVTATADPETSESPASTASEQAPTEASDVIVDQEAPEAATTAPPRHSDAPTPSPDAAVQAPLLPDADRPETELIGPLTTPSQPSATAAPDDGAGTSHHVAAGESLWSITAGLLSAEASPADIAAAWPRLYRANADAIGADPDLIHPGTRLTIPSPIIDPES